MFFRSYITYMLSVTVLYLAFPLMILHSSYNAIYAYFKKTRHFQVLALFLVNTRYDFLFAGPSLLFRMISLCIFHKVILN